MSAGIIAVLLSCGPAERPHTDEDSARAGTPPITATGEHGVAGDTAVAEAAGNVWDDPAWWTEPGPLAPLLDLSLAPRQYHWQLWMATSPDLETWSDPQVIGFNFSSLDVLQLEEGLIVSGSVIPMLELGVEAPFGYVFAFVTTDLVQWGSHFLAIEGSTTPMIIDPSIHWTPDGGLRLLYYGESKNVDPDLPPDNYPNPHHIYTGLWASDRFVQDSEEALLAADYVVDPSGCYWQGTHHVLGTRTYQELFYAYKAEDSDEYVEGLQWGGVQVPFCFVDTAHDRLGLIAQWGGGYGGPPQVKWCDKDMLCAEQVDLIPEEKLYYDSCTSPVLAWYQEQYVLFCSSWVGGSR